MVFHVGLRGRRRLIEHVQRRFGVPFRVFVVWRKLVVRLYFALRQQRLAARRCTFLYLCGDLGLHIVERLFRRLRFLYRVYKGSSRGLHGDILKRQLGGFKRGLFVLRTLAQPRADANAAFNGFRHKLGLTDLVQRALGRAQSGPGLVFFAQARSGAFPSARTSAPGVRANLNPVRDNFQDERNGHSEPIEGINKKEIRREQKANSRYHECDHRRADHPKLRARQIAEKGADHPAPADALPCRRHPHMQERRHRAGKHEQAA